MGNYGYLIDHVPAAQRCCELHNVNCEPPGDLCCDGCPEVDHGALLGHRRCVLVTCGCRSVQQHLDTTQPGYAGDPVGMREPVTDDGVVSGQLPLGGPTEIRASPTGQVALCLHVTTMPGQSRQPRWVVVGTQHADGGLVTVLPVDAGVIASWSVIFPHTTEDGA